MYEKLKALNQYHRRNGEEEILHKKYIEKRAKATKGISQKLPTHVKCIFTEGGVKCGEPTLPCCKFCKKHILIDKKQILFQACNIEKSGVICKEPIANIFENATCYLHIELQPEQSYTMKKYESETEDEDEVLLTPPKLQPEYVSYNDKNVKKSLNLTQSESEIDSPSKNPTNFEKDLKIVYSSTPSRHDVNISQEKSRETMDAKITNTVES